MFTLTMSLLLCLSADFDVCLAPDQPVPHVYVGDQLVLELSSARDSRVNIKVDVEGHDGQKAPALNRQEELKAGGVRWIPLEDVASPRGRYIAHVEVDAGGEVTESSHPFCRIDRAESRLAPPFFVSLDGIDQKTLLALRGLPARQIALDANRSDIGDAIAALEVGRLRSALALDLDRAEDAPKLVSDVCAMLDGNSADWLIAPGSKLDEVAAIAAQLKGGSNRAQFALVAEDADSLSKLLESAEARGASSFALRADAPSRSDVAAFRAAAEKAGCEHTPIHVVGRGIDGDADKAGARMARQLILNMAMGVPQTRIEAGLLFAEGRFSEAYVYISALAHRLNGACHAGELNVVPPVCAQVFRTGEAWVLAVWTTGDPQDLAVQVGEVQRLALYDWFNNPMALGEQANGAITLSVTQEPVYLTGIGGSVMAAAARHTAALEAKSFLDVPAFKKLLPEEVLAIFGSIADPKEPQTDRAGLLALFPLFSHIEEQWHSGAVKQQDAVPAMASLARLVRYLAINEQETGKAFIEPLQGTLARCADHQSRYLTSSGGLSGNRERGDWLLGEVSRLVDESKALSAEGRSIEATVVAMLAEWRADGLRWTQRAAPAEPEDGGKK